MSAEGALDKVLAEFLKEFEKNGVDLADVDLDTLRVTDDPNDPCLFHIDFELLDKQDTE